MPVALLEKLAEGAHISIGCGSLIDAHARVAENESERDLFWTHQLARDVPIGSSRPG